MHRLHSPARPRGDRRRRPGQKNLVTPMNATVPMPIQ
jgi:hypothetical protein